jgi:hypothetical protein
MSNYMSLDDTVEINPRAKAELAALRAEGKELMKDSQALADIRSRGKGRVEVVKPLREKIESLEAEVERLTLINENAIHRLRVVYGHQCVKQQMSDLDIQSLRLFLEMPDIGGRRFADDQTQLKKDAAAGRRLPLTADGVRVVPNVDQVWFRPQPDGPVVRTHGYYLRECGYWVTRIINGMNKPVSECFSTLEALRAGELDRAGGDDE